MKTSWIRSVFSVVAIASLTSGCIMYRLETLRNTTPAGTPFQNELAKLYMDFATQEEKEYDWFNSWHFADKGLMLAYGKEIGPEDLKDWDIPAEELPHMERVRAMLIATLTPDVMRASPSRAADAQFYFDCWVEQQEENWQEDDIAYCRDNLMKALDDLGASGMEHAAKTSTVTKHAEKTKKVAQKTVELGEINESSSPAKTKHKQAKETSSETISYAVFFETNKAELSEPGRNVIGEVIGSLRNVGSYEINLHVSANKDGDPNLSEERIQVVKKRLMDGGIAERAIRTSNTASETSSANPPNRRVEIFLNE